MTTILQQPYTQTHNKERDSDLVKYFNAINKNIYQTLARVYFVVARRQPGFNGKWNVSGRDGDHNITGSPSALKLETLP